MSHEVARRLAISVQPVPKQDADVRWQNFDETYLGFDLNAARVEASRCIQCPSAPCQEACPVGNDIPGALALLETGDILGAADKFRETSNLPEMCGRLCPQEKLCEGSCVVGFAIRPGGHAEPPVTIGKLEAFCTDFQRQKLGGYPMPRYAPDPTGFRVAVIGSGPAGLAVAEQLALEGHGVTVFEYWPEPGGVLVYGIPNFKMRKDIVDEYIGHLRALGVQFVCNTFVGRDVTVDALFAQGFHAVFLGTGAGVGNAMGIEGEDLAGVYAATEFLVRGNLEPGQLPETFRQPLPALGRVVVIGGGDTSMDCVRTAVRLGAAEVTCVYRRTEAEMPGRGEERKNAREEGVRFEMLTLPTRILGDGQGRVRAVECQRMELGAPDESGRRRPVALPGSEFEAPRMQWRSRSVMVRPGYPGVDGRAPGRPEVVDRSRARGRTSRPGVFAGGDNVNGADLVVTALADGRRAAQAIDAYLQTLRTKA